MKMTEDQQQRAYDLLKDFLGIHLFGREKVRSLLSNRENDSYSVMSRRINELIREIDSGSDS